MLTAYWANFIHTQDPTPSAGGPFPAPAGAAWPRYTDATGAGGAGDVNMRIELPPGVTQTGLESSVCDMWDAFQVAVAGH